MEYAKDVFFNLKCESTRKVHRTNLITRGILKAKRHKVIISIIILTALMICLDCFLIANFVNVLSSL
jgi:hypothetical protein